MGEGSGEDLNARFQIAREWPLLAHSGRAFALAGGAQHTGEEVPA